MILFTTTTYPPSFGGSQLYTHSLAQYMQRTMPVQVITHWDSPRSDWLWGTTVNAPINPCDYIIDGVPVHRIGWSMAERLKNLPMALAYLPLQGWAINELASHICNRFNEIAEGADIIHNVRAGREPISFASLMYARQHGIPIVFTPLHHPRWTTWFHRHYLRLYHQVDAIIALTNYERSFLIGMGIPESRVFVTGTNPVVSGDPKPDAFRQKYHIEGPVVLFLGQKYPYKNLKSLLNAAPIVWKSHPHVNFVFMGPRTKYSQNLFRSVSDERIIEIGTVDIQEKSDALMACDMLCMPSSQESFGSVYLEAWTYGKPVRGYRFPPQRTVPPAR